MLPSELSNVISVQKISMISLTGVVKIYMHHIAGMLHVDGWTDGFAMQVLNADAH